MALARLSLCRGRRFQVVQFLGFLGRDQPDRHEVERADEAVADAGSPRRGRSRRGAAPPSGARCRTSAAAESFGMSSSTSQPSSSVKTFTPPSAAASSAPAIAPASAPSSPSMPRPISAPILVPTSIASCLGEVAEVLHLQLAVGVLVNDQRVDDAHRAARVEPLKFGDDLTVEVGMVEPQYDQLHGPNGHGPASFSPPKASGRLRGRASSGKSDAPRLTLSA